MQRVTATRYIQPLREGGSLPAVVDTDDGLFVVKFRGAGQGPKALIAEVISGLIAMKLDLTIPELALVEISEQFGRGEPDPEIQDILRKSHGLNVGMRFLDGAFNFALAAAGDLVDPEWAARVVWMDAFLTNPDRTHRNTNILVWERKPWLIDHGAAIYAHHDWPRVDDTRTRGSFPLIRQHVLLGIAGGLERADEEAVAALDGDVLEQLLDMIPGELLSAEPIGTEFSSPEAARERYHRYLTERLEGPRSFLGEAIEARRALLSDPARPLPARR